MSKISDLSLNDDVNKALVGLGNVDNTSDANKPVSTAQQTAIDAKISFGSTGTTTIGIVSVNTRQITITVGGVPTTITALVL